MHNWTSFLNVNFILEYLSFSKTEICYSPFWCNVIFTIRNGNNGHTWRRCVIDGNSLLTIRRYLYKKYLLNDTHLSNKHLINKQENAFLPGYDSWKDFHWELHLCYVANDSNSS